MNKKALKILNFVKIAVSLFYFVGVFVWLILAQMTESRGDSPSFDGWFWFGALVIYLIMFPIFISLLSSLQLISTKIKYGAPTEIFRKIIRGLAYLLAIANVIMILYSLVIMRSFDYFTYIPISLSVPVLLIAVADSIYCAIRAKKQTRTDD